MPANNPPTHPEEQLDLPRPDLDLPTEPKEIPSHAAHGHTQAEKAQRFNNPSVKTLLAWESPGRPFRKRGKEYFTTALLLTLLFEVLAFLFAQYLLMVAIFALLFVAFALATVPPHSLHNRISTEGVTIDNHFFLWQELYDFYFKKRHGEDVLHIRTHGFPGELVITLGDVSKEHMKDVLIQYLPYREVVTPTFMEKAGNWVSRTFPLERPHSG